MTDTMITARELRKTFSTKSTQVEAVRSLDLDVARGELVAFLGPNGAGKSTTLRMLTTLLAPTSGTATVAGCDIRTDPAGVRARIGYIGQGTSAGHNQRVRDELISQGAFYGMTRHDAIRRTDELLDSLELAPLATRSVMALSGGQKRRLDIALGLIHSPELLFLDEPSTGLDPTSRANLWDHLLGLRREQGTTIFITTHYLDEADRFAERVLVMDAGRVIADDTASVLKSTLAGDVISLGFTTDADATAARSVVERSAGTSASIAPDAASRIEVTVDGGDTLLPRLLRELDAAGATVASAAIRQPTLDDVFLGLTGRSLRDVGDAPGGPDEGSPAPTTETTTDDETTTEKVHA